MTVMARHDRALRDDFMWGFATAATQIESGSREDEQASGKGDSVGPALIILVELMFARFGIPTPMHPAKSVMGRAPIALATTYGCGNRT